MIVYEDVYKTIEMLPTEEEKAAAALALLRYGCGGIEYNGECLYIRLIMQQAKVGIDNAKARYNKATENGKKGGRAKQFKDEEITALKSQGMTNKEVAAALGCSEKTVQRANVANRQNGQNIYTDNTDKKDTTENTDKTDTDIQNLNKNININNNSNIDYTDNYNDKINEYGRRLQSAEERETANYVILTLQNRGFDNEFIYYALKGLKDRNIIQYKALLFSKDYHEQIKSEIIQEHKRKADIKEKAAAIGAAVDKQFEKGVKTISVKAPEKPIDKGYINLEEITDD